MSNGLIGASMAKPNFFERIVAAVLGSVFGSVICLVLAWLFGVYSNTLGPGQVEVSLTKWILSSAVFFGVLGAVLGSAAGTLIGNVIAAIFAFERLEDGPTPWWLVLVILAAVVGLVLWVARGGS